MSLNLTFSPFITLGTTFEQHNSYPQRLPSFISYSYLSTQLQTAGTQG